MNKPVLIILSLTLVFIFGFIFLGEPGAQTASVQNVEIVDGVQYVKITARGGYFPALSTAKAGIPTKLIIKTTGTFDCSSSLVIRSVDFQKILPQTGETEIDIGVPEAGTPIEGVCGMGMYNFKVNFE
ncbi:MAG: cupredoxin domain-containing protein [Minisyncoccia bacterium]